MHNSFELKLNRHLQDLNPIIAGTANCPPGVINQGAETPCTLIHYVTKGKGVLYSKGRSFPVCAGQCFLSTPKEATHWISDSEDPWSYQWVGFTGSLSSHFWDLPPVITLTEPPFPHLKNLRKAPPNLEIELAMDLFGLYAKLVVSVQDKRSLLPDYIQAVFDYVHNHYMEPLNIQQIADHVGLNRDYLYRIFKEKTGVSIQSHLQETRMMEARRFLDLGYSVEKTSKLCGFNSLAHFSRQFKRIYGESPQRWTKNIKQYKAEINPDL